VDDKKRKVLFAVAVILALEGTMWVGYGMFSHWMLSHLGITQQSVIDEFVASLFLVPLLVIAVYLYKMSPVEMGLRDVYLLKHAALGVFVGLSLMLIAGVIQKVTIQFIPSIGYFPSEFDFVRTYETSSGTAKALLFVGYAGIGPIYEEIIYRGIVFGLLRRVLSLKNAVIVSSVLFAMFHVFPILLIVTFVSGCVLAVLRERTGSIVASIAAHVANNGGVLLLAGTA
jgi:uncharacterized protein